MSTIYPNNLSDAEWECLQRHLPTLPKRGRPPTHSLRAIFDAIFYVLRTGCAWRYLPANFPRHPNRVLPFCVFYAIPGTWTCLPRALHRAEREREGRNPHPSAAIMDAASA
jgi:putative transposase